MKSVLENMSLDEAVDLLADGVYVLPISPTAPRYNYRVLDQYCKDKGIEADQLTDSELKQLEVLQNP